MRLFLLFFVHVLLLLAVPAGTASAGRAINGTVLTVYDGDTILLTTRASSRLKVRLFGIDAPETRKPDKPGQPGGEAAKRALMYKIMGRQVTVEVIDIDQYKRVVAVLRYSGRDINREMIGEGMAWAYRQYLQAPYASEYIGSENRARSRRAGIWKESNPVSPWEFRSKLKGQGKRSHHW